MRWLTGVVLISMAAGAAAQAGAPDDVVARVGEAVIRRSDLATEIPEQYKPQYVRVTGELRDTERQAVRELLGTREMEAAARRRHVDVEQIYRETIDRDLESFSTDAQAKIHQIEASIYQADALTLEEIIDRRLYDEGVRRGLQIDPNVAVTDVEFLRAYEAARAAQVKSDDPPARQMAAAAEQARSAVLRARMVAAARPVVKVERLLEPPRVKVATAGAPRLGSPDAPVQVVVFTDFECPYCAETDPVLKQVYERANGAMSLVMRDFPMPQRLAAMPSAIAARCAYRQGQYWPFHELLFQNRTKLTAENFRSFAQQVGIDVNAFDRCVADPLTRSALETEIAQARAYGIDATPTLFVNGRMLAGTVTFEQLSRLVAEEKDKK
jgi:protein-disulfide isomerase